MAKCKKCGEYAFNKRLCRACLNDWLNKRTIAFNAVKEKMGEPTMENIFQFKKEVRKLESED